MSDYDSDRRMEEMCKDIHTICKKVKFWDVVGKWWLFISIFVFLITLISLAAEA